MKSLIEGFDFTDLKAKLENKYTDIIMPVAIARPGVNAPDLDAFNGTDIFQYNFRGAGGLSVSEIFGAVELQHDWVEGSQLEVHLHWCPTTADAGNIVWNFQYMLSGLTSYVYPGAVQLLSQTVAAGGVAYRETYTSLGTISPLGYTIDRVIPYRFFRDLSDGKDTYGFDATALSIGIHYEQDGIGSSFVTEK